MFPLYVKFCNNKFQERYRIVEVTSHVMYGVNVTARTYMYTMYIYIYTVHQRIHVLCTPG